MHRNTVRIARNLFAVMLVAALGMSASAEQRREVQLVRPSLAPAVRFSAPWRPNGANSATRIVGSVFDIIQAPVPYTKVQLRDLRNGVVLGSVDTNEMGQYEFDVTDPGAYVVEMVALDNYVVALSNAALLTRYETLQTEIRLPGRWDTAGRSMSIPVPATAFFGMSSARTMTSSTLNLAASSNVRPMDAGEPVSPQ